MMIEIFRKRIDFLCMLLEIINIPFKVRYMKIQNNKQENCLNADDLMNVMNIQSVEYIFK